MLTTPNTDKNVEQKSSQLLLRNAKWYSILDDVLKVSNKTNTSYHVIHQSYSFSIYLCLDLYEQLYS